MALDVAVVDRVHRIFFVYERINESESDIQLPSCISGVKTVMKTFMKREGYKHMMCHLDLNFVLFGAV